MMMVVVVRMMMITLTKIDCWVHLRYLATTSLFLSNYTGFLKKCRILLIMRIFMNGIVCFNAVDEMFNPYN